MPRFSGGGHAKRTPAYTPVGRRRKTYRLSPSDDELSMQGDPGAFGAANARPGNKTGAVLKSLSTWLPGPPARALQGTYPCRPRDHDDASKASEQPTKVPVYLRCYA